VPAGILGELGYMVETRLGRGALRPFLQNLDEGVLALDCGELDFPRIWHLMDRYYDIRLGFADAAVVACAERNGGRVMTFDRRHFDVVAREGTITVVP
jgi:predicted nucleic acid-binding protein